MIKYLVKVYQLSEYFKVFEITYVPWKQNSRGNLHSKLTSTKRSEHNRPVIQKTLVSPDIETQEINATEASQPTSYMMPIIRYVTTNELPSDELEKKKVWKHVAKYNMVLKEMCKLGRASLMLICLWEIEISLVLTEVHQGTCCSPIDGRALAHKPLRMGYYWLTLMKDNTKFVRKMWQVPEWI